MKKFYSSISKVNLERDAVKRAWQFAQQVVSTVDYSDSNQHQAKKILDDHFVSKLGEEACKKVLLQYADVKGPDYNIYTGKQKTWDADLFVNDIGIAVKTQRRTKANKYSLSWTFQCSPKRRDIILDKLNAWVIFVEYDDTQPYWCYVYPPYQIKELKFDAPKLSRLQASKKVIYANNLPAILK